MTLTNPYPGLKWLPDRPPLEGRLISLRPAGQHWDAIRAPYHLARFALAALEALGSRDFALLDDPWVQVLYWLVPVGTASGWDVPRTRPLGTTQYLAIPDYGRRHPPGPYWLRVPKPGVWLTDPDLLWSALTAAVNTLSGPREVTR